jgi:hypothetical protein
MTAVKAHIQSQRWAHLVVIGIVSFWFAASTALSIYSDARVSMTVGDRYPALWEQIALWTSVILQPWIILALMIEPLGGTYFLSTSLTGSLIAAALSGVILYFIMRRLVGRYRVAGWIVLGLLAVLAALDTSSFVLDMRIIPSSDSYSGT